MKHHIAFIEKLVANGGPEPSEYEEFAQWLETIHKEMSDGALTRDDVNKIRSAFGEALSILTLQGFVYEKPHGYFGDYEIIDKIYLKYTSKNQDLRKWDLFFQLQKAAIAVRNRKAYFIQVLNNLTSVEKKAKKVEVLNIASGPCRDLLEYLTNASDKRVVFDNVEFDPLAISYAKNLCKDYMTRINFLHTNAFDFSSNKKYRLIWSAGLFDYLNDKKFVYLLKRVIPLLENEGEIIIGNFSPKNPSRAYMESLGNWRLRYRSADDLIEIAKLCGFEPADIRVGQEPEGVNLFLHLKRGSVFIPPPTGISAG